jgi:cation:H+ antiporter
MTISLLAVLLSLFLILSGSLLFTNGIEWTGRTLKLAEGVTGSVLAAVGTALPETLIPFLAILFGKEPGETEIGIGAILGAPFMLTTLTLPLAGLWLTYLSIRGRRNRVIRIREDDIQADLGTFLISYFLATAAAVISSRTFHYGAGFILIGVYLLYLKGAWQRSNSEESEPEPLIFQRRSVRPDGAPIAIQTLTGLILILTGATFFISGMREAASRLQIAPMILSLLATPVVTELPEQFNSLIWISREKDHLAFSNITGALVFQSTLPVAIGLFGSAWSIDRRGLLNVALTLTAALFLFAILTARRGWKPKHLFLVSFAYLAYCLVLFFNPAP